MQTQNNNENPIAKNLVKDLVNNVDSFLHRGSRKTFKSIKDAARSMKEVWEKLVFAADDAVCLEWQKAGLKVLERIQREELTGWDAEENLHGVNGMFNQTACDALNVVVV